MRILFQVAAGFGGCNANIPETFTRGGFARNFESKALVRTSTANRLDQNGEMVRARAYWDVGILSKMNAKRCLI